MLILGPDHVHEKLINPREVIVLQLFFIVDQIILVIEYLIKIEPFQDSRTDPILAI